ncbi:hypothetical protein N325_02960, partial [Colius striatus]
NGFNLKEGSFRVDIWKFIPVRVMRLAREAVDVPSLEAFKTRLDETVSNM